jgi:hypothetical protein
MGTRIDLNVALEGCEFSFFFYEQLDSWLRLFDCTVCTVDALMDYTEWNLGATSIWH